MDIKSVQRIKFERSCISARILHAHTHLHILYIYRLSVIGLYAFTYVYIQDIYYTELKGIKCLSMKKKWGSQTFYLISNTRYLIPSQTQNCSSTL